MFFVDNGYVLVNYQIVVLVKVGECWSWNESWRLLKLNK